MKIPDVNLEHGILCTTNDDGSPQVAIDLRAVWAITTRGRAWTLTGYGPVSITLDDFGSKSEAIREAVMNKWLEVRTPKP